MESAWGTLGNKIRIIANFYWVYSISVIFLSTLCILMHLMLTTSESLGSLPNVIQPVNNRARSLTSRSCSKEGSLLSSATNNNNGEDVGADGGQEKEGMMLLCGKWLFKLVGIFMMSYLITTLLAWWTISKHCWCYYVRPGPSPCVVYHLSNMLK